MSASIGSMLEVALQYARRGWKVFPLHSIIDGRCACGKACASPGKHPLVRGGFKQASTEPATIEGWFIRWPWANIGIATGAVSGLVVLDIDGAGGLAELQALAAQHGPLPPTLTVRTGSGAHILFQYPSQGEVRSSARGNLHVRGDGGYIVAAPSRHASGRTYEWLNQLTVAPLPNWLKEWMVSHDNPRQNELGTVTAKLLPPHLAGLPARHLASKAIEAIKTAESTYSPGEFERIQSALAVIPALSYEIWYKVGMILQGLQWIRSDGTDIGLDLWDEWSAKVPDKYPGVGAVEAKWQSFGRSGRGGLGLGSLFQLAQEHGWNGLSAAKEVMPHDAARRDSGYAGSHSGPSAHKTQPRSDDTDQPGGADFFVNSGRMNGHGTVTEEGRAGQSSQSNENVNDAGTSDPANETELNGHAFPFDEPLDPKTKQNPLIALNDKYAVIGDIGGKCLVMSWIPSKVDEHVKIPSFQTFKAFAERHAHRYVVVPRLDKDGNRTEKTEQLGSCWLKWGKRKSYEGIDLMPGRPAILSNGYLNLWHGFAVQPAAGEWPLMKWHIANILAAGDEASARYIVRFAAWAVQNPGERAEVALVFRGGKGSGKGTFANALVRIFGSHGLQIYSSKHLVGAFNGHLRSCLLLFADEAFWAGDKQGESVLKGMLTERTLVIEQKGVDATPWKNRLHVIMAANADWVVPASHDERRYAMFNVDGAKIGDRSYFEALHKEVNAGGLAAMLHDMQHMDLGEWHPRQIVHTDALREQKERSLTPLLEWYESLLQSGQLPGVPDDKGGIAATAIYGRAREAMPRLRDVSETAFGRLLRSMGGEGFHRRNGNFWHFKPLSEARKIWESKFSSWHWRNHLDNWLD